MTTNCDIEPRNTNVLIGTYDEYCEESEAIRLGLASDLYRCPVDDSLQGVESTRTVPGNPRGFDGGDVITLRCGHVIV